MADLHYTPAQEAAITDRGSAVLVSAAAGSGKTRVLVERLLRRVLDPAENCGIDDFLVITFTKKAAAELRARVAKRLSARLAEQPNDRHAARQLARLGLAQITTIDSFCSDLVRRNAFALHVSPDFRQLEADETEALRKTVAAQLLEQRYAALDNDPDFRALVDSLGAGRSDEAVERALLQLYDRAQSHLFPDAWRADCVAQLDLTRVEDVGQTPWGRVLIESFRRFCRGKAGVLRAAVRLCDGQALLQERYAPLLAREAEQLLALAEKSSWDALREAEPVFERMPSFKAAEKNELQEQLAALRNQCKKALLTRLDEFRTPSGTVLAELGSTTQGLRALFDLAGRFTQAYTQEKRRLRVLDFSDLEHGAVQLLLHPDGTPRPLARELSAQYAEILLDEYQDTNEVQDRLFAALSRAGKNLFLVGDVKQAIYRFRLADPGIFLEKYRRFAPLAEAEPGAPRKILLSENFRSGPEILEAANAVFSACMSEQVGGLAYGEDERLREGIPHEPLPTPAVELHCINTKPAGSGPAPNKVAVEADFVARRIRRLLDEQSPVRVDGVLRPVRPADITILLRSVKNTAPYYLEALRAHGLRIVSERESSIFDAPEIETLVSLLQLIDNARQDIPLCAVLLSPVGAMSADTLAALRAAHPDGALYDALCAADAPEAVRFRTLLAQLREEAKTLSLDALLTRLVTLARLEERYALEADGVQKRGDLDRFLALAAAFSEGGKKSLSQFLARLEALRGEQSKSQAQPDAVRLMSIHKSKGLEFPVVVLAGLSTEFNETDLRAPVLLHATLGAGGNVYDAAQHFRYHSVAKRAILTREREELRAEELRVLYVAMTRAQSRLIMTCCGSELHTKLKSLAARLTLPPEPLLAAEASCPGDWVLEAALLRTEAGALFAAGQAPVETQVSALPWLIRYDEITAVSASEGPAESAPPPEAALTSEEAEAALSFRYPCAAATQTPAKLTATQLKGRRKDAEASEGSDTRQPAVLRPRRPCFDQERPLSPAERGIATHLAMQYLDFDKTGSPEAIEAELARLVREQFLTPQQAEAVSAQQLYRIFAGPVGQRIRAADRVVREFKFSLLVDAGEYTEAAGERLLLQGVTDCCLIRDGALCVIDFKTDRLRPGEEAQAAERYRGQLEAYSMALSRIFGLPVKEKLLYFFATDSEFVLKDQ